jgi:RNA polymerase primary sigma factor
MNLGLKNETSNFKFYNQYLEEVRRYPLLNSNEERRLVKAVRRGDKGAFDKLITANLRFVVKVAFMYLGQGLPIGDLINEGNIGLMEAAKRYRPDKDVKFTSYAVWWVRQAIVKAIQEKSRLVRISAEKELALRRIQKQVHQSNEIRYEGDRPDADQISRKFGLSKNKVDAVLAAAQSHVSLDKRPFEDSNASYLDILEDNTDETADKIIQRRSMGKIVSRLFQALSEKERKVIRYFFGFSGNKAMNLREISDLLGLSKERVRQIKEEALEKLRNVRFQRAYLLAA